MRFWFIAFYLLVAVAISAGCSQKSFNVDSTAGGPNATGDTPTPTPTPPGTTPTPTAPTCRTVLHTTTVPIKLMFIVDTSGSNQWNDNGGVGSDPNKTYRGGSITQFFADYSRYSNFNWGFATFSGTTAQALIGLSSTQPMFSPSAYDMQNAINNFYSIADGYNTPYQAAIQMAKYAIQNDPGRTAQTKYIVVFLSDGLPVPPVSDATLADDVRSVTGLVPGQVSFNTIYYGTSNAQASGRLSMMASVGGGRFLDTNTNPSGRDFPIDHTITIPGIECTP